jgi:hypothetical protein
MQFWHAGVPFAGLQKGTHDAGQMQFWVDGVPFAFLFPVAALADIDGFPPMGGILHYPYEVVTSGMRPSGGS